MITETSTKKPHPQSARSEQQLLLQARSGGFPGELARTQLLQSYYPWIRLRCAQILRNRADADDASQEVALRMHKNLSHFEGRSSLRTWIGTIVTRECINLMRKNSRTVLQAHIAEMICLHEELLRGDAPALQALERDTVNSILRDLDPKSRDVLQLRFYSDLSLDAISGVLNITLSAAKMRLYRALEQFNQAYSAAA